jgi:Ni,Fe-hydrogenase III small subunit
MLDIIRLRLQQGRRTMPFPPDVADMPERFRGLPVLNAQPCRDAVPLPSEILTTDAAGAPALDVGACLFGPDEAGCTQAGTIAFTREYRMATSSRQALVTRTGEIELTRALGEQTRRLFARSLRLRSVVAGSCNGCECELVALGNVVFDLARFGVQFVASPRHADGVVITGTVNRNMRDALERTIEAVPEPRIVIAVGACAIAGGPFVGSTEAGAGVPPEIPIDLYVPGCPPHPLTTLDGLVRLLGRMPG